MTGERLQQRLRQRARALQALEERLYEEIEGSGLREHALRLQRRADARALWVAKGGRSPASLRDPLSIRLAKAR